MDNMTIGEVSSSFQVSTRMLRYYEKAGLVESTRKEGYAYRIYDADAVKRIRQIIILRKLQIPLKQIQRMIDGNREEAICILEARIHAMDENAMSICTMKRVMEKLLKLLRDNASETNYMDLIQENAIVELTKFLPLEKHHLKEEYQMSIAKEMAEKGKSVRIMLLPPCTVASYQFTGDDPEEAVGEVMNTFIRTNNLYGRKPDARLFGFNNPDSEPDSGYHGYEEWLTIPDDMEVEAPLVKKQFSGGLYAAYTISFPDFHEWNFLVEWAKNNETYQADFYGRDRKDMSGCMEEYLNSVYSSHMGWPENGIDGQVDLLLPIKKR